MPSAVSTKGKPFAQLLQKLHTLYCHTDVSPSRGRDLCFSDFSKLEKNKIVQDAVKRNLKVRFFSSPSPDGVVVYPRRTILELVGYLRMCGGQSEQYILQEPRGRPDVFVFFGKTPSGVFALLS